MSENDNDQSNAPVSPSTSQEGEYKEVRPSSHEYLEQSHKMAEARDHLEVARSNSSGQGLVDAIGAVADAKNQHTDRHGAEKEWLVAKEGPFPYSDTIKTFDLEENSLDAIAERALAQSNEHSVDVEQSLSSELDHSQEPQRNAGEDRLDAIAERALDAENSVESGHENELGNGQNRD